STATRDGPRSPTSTRAPCSSIARGVRSRSITRATAGPRERTPCTGPRTRAPRRPWSSPSTSSSREAGDAPLVPPGADGEGGPPGDEPRPALIRRVGPRPLEEDQEPVPEADQEEDVHEEPGEPGDEAREVKPPDDGHRGGAADGRDASLVTVAEALG